jgi:predicted nucleotide-binding protein (sugar kinase/HSP70/actin superfamily)
LVAAGPIVPREKRDGRRNEEYEQAALCGKPGGPVSRGQALDNTWGKVSSMDCLQRIGFPHALLAYRYYLWKEFLVNLGFDIAESARTTRSIVEKGISLTVDDTCVPIKALVGHVDQLLKRNIECLFLPRIVALKRHGRTYYPCPKMIGLPDVVKAVFKLSEKTSPRVLDLEIDERREPMEKAMLRFARETLGAGKMDAASSLRKAVYSQEQYMKTLCSLEGGKGAKGKIAVIGHPYLVFDDYLSLGLLRKLRQMDVNVVTQFAVPEDELEKNAEEFSWLSWGYEREILGAICHFAKAGSVDGIIYLTSFGCGPFAVLSELVTRSIRKKSHVPVLPLMMDELTGEAGVMTRVESFLDMIQQRSR